MQDNIIENMRTLKQSMVYVFIVASLLGCESSPNAPVSGSPTFRQSTEDVSIFIAHNLTSLDVGTIGIADSSNLSTLHVYADTSVSTPISFTPRKVTVFSQSCPYPDTTVVSTGSGATVKVAWSSPDLIIVLDYEQMNRAWDRRSGTQHNVQY